MSKLRDLTREGANRALLGFVKSALIEENPEEQSGSCILSEDVVSEIGAVYFSYHVRGRIVRFRVDDRYCVEERLEDGSYVVGVAALLLKSALRNKAMELEVCG